MSISVGDFAEQLIAQGQTEPTKGIAPPVFEGDPSVYSADVAAQAPDISEVVVPNDFVNSIVESKGDFSQALAESKAPVERVAGPQAPQGPIEPLSEMTELKTLIQELKDMIVEVKNTLSEMTTVGAIGVNMAGPEKKKKKSKKPSTGYEAMLQRIKNKKKASVK
jgi:hypothetical protein